MLIDSLQPHPLVIWSAICNQNYLCRGHLDREQRERMNTEKEQRTICPWVLLVDCRWDVKCENLVQCGSIAFRKWKTNQPYRHKIGFFSLYGGLNTYTCLQVSSVHFAVSTHTFILMYLCFYFKSHPISLKFMFIRVTNHFSIFPFKKKSILSI